LVTIHVPIAGDQDVTGQVNDLMTHILACQAKLKERK